MADKLEDARSFAPSVLRLAGPLEAGARCVDILYETRK